MTLLEPTPEIVRERSLPILETARLVLRAPSLADAETLATLVNDRRIAEMTTRIPYPNRPTISQPSLAGCNRGAAGTAILAPPRDATTLAAWGTARGPGPPPD